MFTATTIFAMLVIGYAVGKANEKDRAASSYLDPETETRAVILHARQDIKLIVFVLAAILVMLGVLADIGTQIVTAVRASG